MISGKTFRVFVSSTFGDLKEERNALQESVFPRLRELCMRHGCRFQAIDLRWGVSEDASLNQQTMRICLEEVSRCQRVTPRPNFIVLLGDRYGWQPLPYEIPFQEFDEIMKRANPEDRELLLWDDKQANNNKGWYRKDENAKPVVYSLRPKMGTNWDSWDESEKRLRSILQDTVQKMGLSEDKRLKYLSSATEQEVYRGALNVEDANEHVYCFFRTIKNLPIDESTRDYVDLDCAGNLDLYSKKKLEDLKDRLKTILPGNVYHYDAQWTGNGVTREHLHNLCEDVYESLSKIIVKEVERIENIDETYSEVIAHNSFLNEKVKFFIGRVEILEQANEYLQSHDNRPLVIQGLSGSGKTALMAKLAEQAMERYPESVVITRFIGATPGSTSMRNLLVNLNIQVSRCYGLDEATIPTEYQKLADDFRVRLFSATREKPLILFLDALDQLLDFDNARSLGWLPFQLPDNVHLIVSVLPGDCYGLLEKEVPATNILRLEPMPEKEGDVLLDLWLREGGRALQPWQKEEVLKKFSTNGLPLFLKLAFEEARRWKSYTNPETCTLSSDITGIINDMFRRLSVESNHGSVIVSKSLGYLVASRYGLAEDEMIDVLSLDKEVITDFKRRAPRSPDVDRLPVIVWSRLYFDMEPYLMERNVSGFKLLSFYHRQIAEVAAKEYLGQEKATHSKLAEYFKNRPLSERKIDELPWQLYKAENWEELKDCITDMDIFPNLNTDTKKYELMAYWHDIDNRYDMVKEYNKILKIYDNSESEKLARLNDEIARFFELYAKYTEAEPLYRRALSIREMVYGPGSPETATSLNNMASLLSSKGNYNEAEPLYRRALVIRENVYGSEHPETAISLNNLGFLLEVKGDYKGAESLYRRALVIREKVLGTEHLDTAQSLTFLASVLSRKPDYVGAELLFRRALAIKEKVCGPEHPETAISLNGVAFLLSRNGKYDEAERLLIRALAIDEKVYGPEHPGTAIFLNALALMFSRKGDYDVAEPLYRRALAINENVYGPEHRDTAASLNNLASVLAKKGNYDEAERLLIRALAIHEKALGSEHPNTAYSLNELAFLLSSKGNYDEAEPLYRRALAINEKVYGPEHSNTLISINDLAHLLSTIFKFDEAEHLHRRALAINEGVYGTGDLKTLQALNSLADMLENNGDYDGAEPLYRRALVICEKVLGENHQYTIDIRNKLNMLVSKRKELKESLGMILRQFYDSK